MSEETSVDYGDLYDSSTGDYIRPATKREAMQSLSAGPEGAISVNGRTVWVDGACQAHVCDKPIQIDLSGVGNCWLAILADDLTADVSEVIAGEIMDGDCESGKICIGGVWYRW